MLIFFRDFSSTVIFLLIILVFFYVAFITEKWRFFKFAWNNNAFFVPLLPYIGTMYLTLFSSRKDVITALNYANRKFGFPLNLWYGHNYYYFTKDPEESKMVLHNLKAQNKGSVYKNIAYVFQNSLLVANYNKWRLRRKEYAKSFKPSILKVVGRDYFNGSCNLVENIKNMHQKKITYAFFVKYAFTNFFKTSIGLKKEPKNMNRFGECLMMFQEDVAQMLLNPLTHPAVWLHVHPGGRNTAKHMNEAKLIHQEILQDKMEQRTNFKTFVDNHDAPPLLDVMMSLKGTILTDQDIFDELIFFAAVASDSSGHALMFMCTLIGMFPDVQQNIYKEIMEVVGQKPIHPDDLPSLVYIEAFIHESLRLFPIVPVLSRKLDEDLNLGHKIVPKGTNVAISVFHLHRDEKYWPNPLKFDPSRFLPENASKIHPFSYLAFSTGPRDCLGKAQAIAMLKITIASVVRNFKISSKHKSIEEFELMSSLTLKTTHPLDCQLELRL